MSRGGAGVVGAIAFAIAAACTSFGAAPEPSPDASAPDADRVRSESDASADADASCKSTVCSDFSASPVWTGWTLDDDSQTGGGFLAQYNGDSMSPPSSIVFELPPYNPETWDGGGHNGGRARLCK